MMADPPTIMAASEICTQPRYITNKTIVYAASSTSTLDWKEPLLLRIAIFPGKLPDRASDAPRDDVPHMIAVALPTTIMIAIDVASQLAQEPTVSRRTRASGAF